MNRFTALLLLIVVSNLTTAQTLTIDLGLGVNSPSDDFVTPYEAKPINGLTVDAGIRYMFKKKLGVKADMGFNRYGNGGDSPEFKANFTRVNLQAYYNVWDHLYNFQIPLPERLGIFLHAGPGMSFLKPLSEPHLNNTSSNFNVIAGLALHYGISDRVSVFIDGSNIFNMGQETAYEGTVLADKINSTMLNVTFGVSISINSDCYFCEKPEME
ncbi:MAG: outer membrane beta-barrel protein [Flavobacteriaceae bacterium]